MGALDRIERLLTVAPAIEISDTAKLRAAQRAVDKRASFHHGKNSMADAMLIETYADSLAAHAGGVRFAFITHNKTDFSNERGDHPSVDTSKPARRGQVKTGQVGCQDW